MIKTPLSTVLGGAFWTPGATVIGGNTPTFDQQIKKLFANGEQGFWYDPSDLSTMFQDAAGAVPINAAGQPVGLIRDKSGRNNHAFQTNSASRPILRQNAVTGANYLEFDGTDDFLQTSNIDFTGTDKVSLFAGVRKLGNSSPAVVYELSGSWGVNPGTFALLAPSYVGGVGYTATARLDIADTVNQQAIITSGYSSPVSSVITSLLATDTKLRVDGVLKVTNNANKGTGNYGNYPLNIGRRGGASLPLNGHIYGLIGIGKLVSDSETVAIEKELAKHVGVTLNV